MKYLDWFAERETEQCSGGSPNPAGEIPSAVTLRGHICDNIKVGSFRVNAVAKSVMNRLPRRMYAVAGAWGFPHRDVIERPFERQSNGNRKFINHSYGH